eukprot:SAG31_NODE_45528_length_258_cov_0.974843_1_plen_28_part_01
MGGKRTMWCVVPYTSIMWADLMLCESGV